MFGHFKDRNHLFKPDACRHEQMAMCATVCDLYCKGYVCLADFPPTFLPDIIASTIFTMMIITYENI